MEVQKKLLTKVISLKNIIFSCEERLFLSVNYVKMSTLSGKKQSYVPEFHFPAVKSNLRTTHLKH